MVRCTLEVLRRFSTTRTGFPWEKVIFLLGHLSPPPHLHSILSLSLFFSSIWKVRLGNILKKQVMSME